MGFIIQYEEGRSMARICDDCGDSFNTLTRLRLHDCPGSGDLIKDALYPVPRPENLPERAIHTDEFDLIQSDDRSSLLSR